MNVHKNHIGLGITFKPLNRRFYAVEDVNMDGLEEGLSIYKTFEPTDSPIGSVIRNILNRRIQAHEKTIGALFLADRMDHITNPVNGMNIEVRWETTGS